MLQITPRIAAALTHLIAVIDGDSKPHPDWVDAVCTARAALPTETVKALESAASPSHGAHDIVMLPIPHDDLDRACEALKLETGNADENEANAELANRLAEYL